MYVGGTGVSSHISAIRDILKHKIGLGRKDKHVRSHMKQTFLKQSFVSIFSQNLSSCHIVRKFSLKNDVIKMCLADSHTSKNF